MENIKGGLIVSCQALENEPLHSSFVMSKMATAVVEGGACGIRANSVSDIIEIKKVADVPVIGIIKKVYGDCPVFITPTIKEVEALVEIGVDIIAIDGTKRERPDGNTLENLIKEVKSKYPQQKLMADISTTEEAIYCEKLGFDFIGTTLVGYTEYSKNLKPIEVLKDVVNSVNALVIAEGNINTPELVQEAYNAGAYSVVVGSMITRPQLITKKFVDAIEKLNENKNNKYFAFDIGGTAVKYGIVTESGEIQVQNQISTTEYDNMESFLTKLYSIVDEYKDEIAAIGISCTGKINEETGCIIGGVEIMKNWINTPLKALFEKRYNLPVYVNNDVKCIGLNELWLGEGTRSKNFICVAIGTGIGGAVVNNGKLISGENNYAGEIGHTTLIFNGEPCKCGKQGCYEAYGSMSALIKRVKTETGETLTGKEIFSKAQNNETIYVNIINQWIDNIAMGISNILQVVDPKTVVIGGAVSVQKELFLDVLFEKINEYVQADFVNKFKIVPATNFNNAGMLGAVYGVKTSS